MRLFAVNRSLLTAHETQDPVVLPFETVVPLFTLCEGFVFGHELDFESTFQSFSAKHLILKTSETKVEKKEIKLFIYPSLRIAAQNKFPNYVLALSLLPWQQFLTSKKIFE